MKIRRQCHEKPLNAPSLDTSFTNDPFKAKEIALKIDQQKSLSATMPPPAIPAAKKLENEVYEKAISNNDFEIYKRQ